MSKPKNETDHEAKVTEATERRDKLAADLEAARDRYAAADEDRQAALRAGDLERGAELRRKADEARARAADLDEALALAEAELRKLKGHRAAWALDALVRAFDETDAEADAMIASAILSGAVPDIERAAEKKREAAQLAHALSGLVGGERFTRAAKTSIRSHFEVDGVELWRRVPSMYPLGARPVVPESARTWGPLLSVARREA
jgi:hypothetical protein